MFIFPFIASDEQVFREQINVFNQESSILQHGVFSVCGGACVCVWGSVGVGVCVGGGCVGRGYIFLFFFFSFSFFFLANSGAHHKYNKCRPVVDK